MVAFSRRIEIRKFNRRKLNRAAFRRNNHGFEDLFPLQRFLHRIRRFLNLRIVFFDRLRQRHHRLFDGFDIAIPLNRHFDRDRLVLRDLARRGLNRHAEMPDIAIERRRAVFFRQRQNVHGQRRRFPHDFLRPIKKRVVENIERIALPAIHAHRKHHQHRINRQLAAGRGKEREPFQQRDAILLSVDRSIFQFRRLRNAQLFDPKSGEIRLLLHFIPRDAELRVEPERDGELLADVGHRFINFGVKIQLRRGVFRRRLGLRRSLSRRGRVENFNRNRLRGVGVVLVRQRRCADFQRSGMFRRQRVAQAQRA